MLSGIDDEHKTDIPTDTIRVDFPLSKQKIPCSAQVISWDVVKDIAILRFTSNLPHDAIHAELIALDMSKETKFRTFGFPKNYDAGVWATGVIKRNKCR